MKKFLLILTLLFAGVGLMACSQNAETEYSDYTYLSLEINPAVDFVLDAEGNVLTYRYRNEEAEVVGAGLNLIGKNYEEALQLYLNSAIDTGYIDISRSDGAVMIQAGGKEDSVDDSFMVQVETKLQTFFQENAIGAVVLKNEEVDEDAKELVETYEVTYGFAKMVLAYLEADETAELATVIEMEPKELMSNFVTEANQYRDRYQNQVEAGAQAIKDELVDALKLQVQAHRAEVTAGTASQPDISGVKQAYIDDFEALKAQYRNRNQERIQQAKENVSEKAPVYFSVDINPSVDFIIDGNGYVLSYMLKNEDAEIVAAGLQMEGLHYQEALRLYLDAAIQTGYIDVERADNAVMIQNAGVNQELENAFMNQTQTMMQNFFYENAIGAVVMAKGEFDEAVQLLAEEYDISYGFAKLVLAYLATDETLNIEEVVLMTPKEIIDLLEIECEEYMNQYRNHVEAGSQAIKDELVEALQAKVQNHNNEVENNQKTQPDISGLKEMYLADYENIHNQYVNRNQVRLQEAKASQNNKAN